MKDPEFDINSNPPSPTTGDDKAAGEDLARDEADAKRLAAELEDMRQTLVRHQADFANFRKRAEKENREAGQRATARIIEQLIPVIDGFEHALAAHREAEYENYRKGFELIHKQLLDNVVRLGVERIEPQNQPFDPRFHQAVEREETTKHPDGTILQVYQPGYAYHGRVLRPAMVRVAVPPKAASNKFAN
ncbi:MAG: nucleotide exchange factor GrpE [Candidatus Acidiferrum sp.]